MHTSAIGPFETQADFWPLTIVHDPIGLPLAEVVARIRDLAKPLGARPIEAELIGLLPEAALAGYPEDVPIRDFDPDFHVIEKRCS